MRRQTCGAQSAQIVARAYGAQIRRITVPAITTQNQTRWGHYYLDAFRGRRFIDVSTTASKNELTSTHNKLADFRIYLSAY